MRLHSLFYALFDPKSIKVLETLSIKKLVKSDLNLLHEPFMRLP